MQHFLVRDIEISSVYAAVYIRDHLARGTYLLVFLSVQELSKNDPTVTVKRHIIVPFMGDNHVYVGGPYRFLGIATELSQFKFVGEAVGYENKIMSSMIVGVESV